MFRTHGLLAIAAIAVMGTTLAQTPSAEARTRKICDFAAFNGATYETSSWRVFERGTHWRKTDKACREAKRKCERALKKARRKNQIPRGTRVPVCLRM